MNESAGSGEREIRLALVCFGGVSLAVYMAGITREIQYLVEASQAMGTAAEHKLTGTAARYAAALRRRTERDDGVPTPWDISVFPFLAASRVQQFTPVRMRRISPVDATALCGDKAKRYPAAPLRRVPQTRKPGERLRVGPPRRHRMPAPPHR